MAIRPVGYLRKVLAHDESVLFIVRQHGLFLLARMFWWLVLAVIMIGVILAVQVGAAVAAPALSIGYVVVVVPLTAVWWQYLAWSNHQYVMTDRRVIQLTGVLNKEVVDSLLEKLNDVKTDQSLLGRIFDYGDIEILTASESGANQFRRVARPLAFKRAMLDAKDKLERALAGH